MAKMPRKKPSGKHRRRGKAANLIGPWSHDAAIDLTDGRTREGKFIRAVRLSLVDHVGGKPWKTWSKALLEAVLPHQDKNGSWPPAGVWGADGGRVYSTAMMVLALETSYRHARAK